MLLSPRIEYKPFEYPWAHEAWEIQQRIHWLPEEVPLADDIKQWKTDLSRNEKSLLMNIFRFFTQSDVEVSNCYMAEYGKVFKPPEIRSMLASFSNMETIHMVAYAHLVDSLSLPDSIYSEFIDIPEMKVKHDHLQNFTIQDIPEFTDSSKTEHTQEYLDMIAKTMAVFGAFTEGLQLFSSFAILLNFPRFNKMKGMGQIITWSVRDETLHCENICRLFNTFKAEYPSVWRSEVKKQIYEALTTTVHFEDDFIKYCFQEGSIEGLTELDIKRYIRYIADRRLEQIGLKPTYLIEKNPLPWMEGILNLAEHSNFFEVKATEYSNASTKGDWGDVWGDMDQGDNKII